MPQIINLNLQRGERVAFISDIHTDSQTPASRIDDYLATTVGKLGDICDKCIERNVKAVFLEGDVFNRTQTTHYSVNLMGVTFQKFKDAGIQTFSICGNHDIIRNSLDNLEKSPIYTLFACNLVRHINLDYRIMLRDGVMLTPADFVEYPCKADKSMRCNILLAHMFYNASEYLADERHNLTDRDVEALGYDLIVLGHDHAEYPIMRSGSTIIVRHGSLTRGTSHDYNFSRKPNFLVLNDLDNVCEETIEKVEVRHLPYEDVASSHILNKGRDSLSDLRDALSNLAEKLAMSSEEDEDRILEIIKTDKDLPNNSRLQILNYLTESA